MPINPAISWRQVAVLSVMCASIIAMLISFTNGMPLLIYNASGSAPLGFYYLEQRLPARGELALFRPPPGIQLLIIAHGVLPVSVPLLKQVAAAGGDEVCRAKEPVGAISINGKVIAEVFEKDHKGRSLPTWVGCLRLVEGELFLLQPHPHSFDSRYFGPVLRCDILGVAHPLWTWNPES
ncbi:S26 family signal peptidase [Bradyrhizobium sp. CB3481]|uniref:S26 family signal peptidase n=1 Tax=Bradyrhizobium sp. CB3481 TaxID=3039158 RepID=UPI0024B14EE5|nr:S26 family signal peptidase [Bradyrhizobium sp. CB3481]WFU14367.1 S26 family signal peptidase [Bradyrhizobium sp. CB3481]